jgi:hypothetical protein
MKSEPEKGRWCKIWEVENAINTSLWLVAESKPESLGDRLWIILPRPEKGFSGHIRLRTKDLTRTAATTVRHAGGYIEEKVARSALEAYKTRYSLASYEIPGAPS